LLRRLLLRLLLLRNPRDRLERIALLRRRLRRPLLLLLWWLLLRRRSRLLLACQPIPGSAETKDYDQADAPEDLHASIPFHSALVR
jgi:hypothetical protein